jgi:redox-sensitive bicupin YhaK (pirin superfamily)
MTCELNLMTAGCGISHSEVSTSGTTVLHGAQLWVALPAAARFADPGFEHYVPDPVPGPGFTARVFIGSLLGASSPVTGYSPLVGAEITIEPGQRVEIAVDPAFEHGVLVDGGGITVNGVAVAAARLGYLEPGQPALELRAGGLRARVLLLGGAPLGEQIVMWWNFIGRTHQEIANYRAAWQAEIASPIPALTPRPASDLTSNSITSNPTSPTNPSGAASFGLPADDPAAPIPAPPLPNATLHPRG